ncbi:MAG: hypothetical protein HKP37_03955 [Boseongicola sp.]|nr:hypothetical protein [Boseongicola sp.]
MEPPETALDYEHCCYGASRVAFRGPKRPLDGGYLAVIGGSQTYGKYVEVPFVDALEGQIGEPVVNLGVMQAGLTLIAEDPDILPVAQNARMTVVEVLGAQNMSNRFYSVHPRRNDRFVSASLLLQRAFPAMDFTEFHFTGHLLTELAKGEDAALKRVIAELKTAWISRMELILSAIPGEKILLWMADRPPEGATQLRNPLDPHFVDREMLETVSHRTAGIVEVVADDVARSEGLQGKVFLDHEEQAAEAMPGPLFHSRTATALAEVIRDPEKAKRASFRQRAS